MKSNIVYVVKIRDKDDNRIYKGKNNNVIKDPFSYQLMEFAEKYGFETKYDAFHAPVSYGLEGTAECAEIIPLEVY